MNASPEWTTQPRTPTPTHDAETAAARLLVPDGPVHVAEIVAGRWSGKTTVLDELARRAAAQGWTVAAAAASPTGADRPLGLFAGVLDSVNAADSPGSPGSPDGERALRAALRATADGGGLLLALDDVHWADEASLRLLGRLLEQPVEGPVRVALVRRERPGDRLLNGMLARCAARGGALRVRPAPLSEEAAIGLLPADLSRVQCEILLRESGGNPGLLRAFSRLRQVPGPAAGPWARPLPPELLAQVLGDFRALTPDAWKVVRAAAVLGEPFEPQDLREVAQVEDAALWGALDELCHEQLIRSGELPWQLRFCNPLLRVAAYQSAGPGWLLGAHAQAAELLARRGPDGPDGADLARHADMARHLERGAALHDGSGGRVLLDAAARQLWRDPGQAVSWIRTAMALHPRVDVTPRDRLLLGRALVLSGRFTAALEALDPPAADGTADAAVRAHAVALRARAHRLLGRPERGEAELAAADRELTGDQEATGDRESTGDRPRGVLLLARQEHALHTHRTDSPSPGRDEGPPPETVPRALRARMLAQDAAHAARAGDTERAERRCATARQLLRAASDAELAEDLEGLYWLGTAEAALGRAAAAAALYERGLRIAETRHLVGLVPAFAMALGSLQLHVGDRTGAARHAACAEAAAAATDSEPLLERARRLKSRAMDGAETGEGGGAARWRPGAEDGAGAGLDGLSRRETEVAVLVSSGLTNQQIARSLELSHKTVETYLGRIFQKLGVQSRAEVAATVGRAGRPRRSVELPTPQTAAP